MRRGWCVFASLLLAGCQTLAPPPTVPVTPAAIAAQQQRARQLGLAEGACLAPGWALDGRVALSNGHDGGSGRLEWVQGGDQLRLQLSAPITRQTWVLEVGPAGAILRGLAAGEQHADNPQQLLRAATGWDVPVMALGCWLRAVAADSVQFGQAQLTYGADLLPQTIVQNGWRIEYRRWETDPFTRLPMPARIEATRGESKVKLAVDHWGQE